MFSIRWLRRRTQLGVANGKLADCPSSPNCVSTQAADLRHAAAPIPIVGEPAEFWRRVQEVVRRQPRTRIVRCTSDYLHAECRSRLLRFVDDLELWMDVEDGQLHARSASRIGHHDFGVNRRRLEHLLALLRV